MYMVLGSCVGVILYDKRDKRSACCHYMLPRTPQGVKPRLIHGTVSIVTLIRVLGNDGTQIPDLEAQVFGGSDLHGRTTGKENIEVAINILEKKGIHISSTDVGGDKGRKVIYNSETNHLAVVKVEKIRTDDWYLNGGK